MSETLLSVQGQLVRIPVEEYTGVSGIIVDPVNKTIRPDETVLFASTTGGTNSDVDFIETRNNFEYVRIIYRQNDGHNECKDVYNIYNNNNLTLNSFTLFNDFPINKISKYTFKNDGTGITFAAGGELQPTGWSSGGRIYIVKVIGINHKAQ